MKYSIYDRKTGRFPVIAVPYTYVEKFKAERAEELKLDPTRYDVYREIGNGNGNITPVE